MILLYTFCIRFKRKDLKDFITNERREELNSQDSGCSKGIFVFSSVLFYVSYLRLDLLLHRNVHSFCKNKNTKGKTECVCVCVCECINAKSGDERGTTNPGHAPIACSSRCVSILFCTSEASKVSTALYRLHPRALNLSFC